MSEELDKVATRIVEKLRYLETERLRISKEGLAELERLDPDTAKLVRELWDDSNRAADWFTSKTPSFDGLTPWQCIAEGRYWDVQIVLGRAIHEIPIWFGRS